jgi:hypothetical protein
MAKFKCLVSGTVFNFEYEHDIAESVTREADRQEKESARAALFTRLGMTADEARLLLS